MAPGRPRLLLPPSPPERSSCSGMTGRAWPSMPLSGGCSVSLRADGTWWTRKLVGLWSFGTYAAGCCVSLRDSVGITEHRRITASVISMSEPHCRTLFETERKKKKKQFNPLNPELNPICYLLTLLGAHHFLHVSRIRIKLLTFRLLMSYIYGAPILDVSRSHTRTQHSR